MPIPVYVGGSTKPVVQSQNPHTWQHVWGGAFPLQNDIGLAEDGRQEEILTKLTEIEKKIK